MKKISNKSISAPAENIYEKRFLMLMKLIKINSMLSKAKIVYPEKQPC